MWNEQTIQSERDNAAFRCLIKAMIGDERPAAPEPYPRAIFAFGQVVEWVRTSQNSSLSVALADWCELTEPFGKIVLGARRLFDKEDQWFVYLEATVRQTTRWNPARTVDLGLAQSELIGKRYQLNLLDRFLADAGIDNPAPNHPEWLVALVV